MKTILMVFDGGNFSEGGLEFVRRLNELNPIQLVVLIMSTYDRSLIDASRTDDNYLVDYVKMETEGINSSIERLKSLCEQNRISFRIQNDSGALDPFIALERATRFADLLIIGSEVFYKELNTFSGVNENLNEILHKSECPIMLVPEKMKFPVNIILAYDGSELSLFAIKLYTYLFPEFNLLPTILTYVSQQPGEMPEREHVEVLLNARYKNLKVQMIDTKTGLYDWLGLIDSPLVVAGSYNRSRISEFFKTKFLEGLINQYRYPIFIAHK